MANYSNILIAEDDFEDYIFFATNFKKISKNLSITHSKNDIDCMRILKESFKPDLIFLDLNMPGYTGLDCLKFIKAKEDLADIPVIIYSTSLYIRDIDACFKNEAHYFIVKPASNDGLVYLLKQVINRLEKSSERPCKNEFVVRMTADLASSS